MMRRILRKRIIPKQVKLITVSFIIRRRRSDANFPRALRRRRCYDKIICFFMADWTTRRSDIRLSGNWGYS